MFTEVSKFFSEELQLEKHNLEELFSLFQIHEYEKGSILLKANTTERRLRFLNHGVVREYYKNKNKEVNINFFVKPQFISDFLSFNTLRTSQKHQECLLDTQILSVEREAFFTLLQNYECGRLTVEQSFKQLLKHKELQEFNRITKTPEELYRELFLYKPEWLQLIPQYHIASFLNITPETLSRIRKRSS